MYTPLDPAFNLAANMRALRAIRAESRSKVAKAVGVSPLSLHLWESGKSLPKTANLMKLASYYGVTVMTLMDSNVLLAPMYRSDK